MTGKWTIKRLNRHDGRPLPMPWHAIPPHTPIPPRDLSHHSMRVLYEDDDVGTGVTHGEVMGYVNEQIRGGSMSTTSPREEPEMTTNIERAIGIIEGEHDPHFGPIDAPSLVYALSNADLLRPDHPEPNSTIDGEPSWEVQREDEHFEIGMYDDFSGITFDNYTTGAMISLPPSDMREAAYALLAAADYAEQEQGDG